MLSPKVIECATVKSAHLQQHRADAATQQIDAEHEQHVIQSKGTMCVKPSLR